MFLRRPQSQTSKQQTFLVELPQPDVEEQAKQDNNGDGTVDKPHDDAYHYIGELFTRTETAPKIKCGLVEIVVVAKQVFAIDTTRVIQVVLPSPPFA